MLQLYNDKGQTIHYITSRSFNNITILQIISTEKG